MRKYLVSAALFASMLSPALSADMRNSVAVPSFDWSGFYVGAHIGGGRMNTDWTYIAGGATADHDGGGILGGGQIGYNWQVDSWVFGAEADISASGIDGDTPCPNPAFTCSSEAKWLASVRGRVGYSPDNFLIYATGGLGIARLEFDARDAIGGGVDAKTKTGWTAGAGVEYAFSPNWSVKAEYQYYDFDSSRYTIGPFAEDIRADSKFHTGKIGINYRF